jgi:hypothetical protein
MTTAETDTRDRGSALVLVLVLIVVGALVFIPMMSYGVSVLHANQVVSTRTRSLEATKAGLRVALADPTDLFATCAGSGTGEPVQLHELTLNGTRVVTRCAPVGQVSAVVDGERHIGVAALRAGATVPAAMSGARWLPANPSSTSEWIYHSTSTPTDDRIWNPNLPVPISSVRQSTGHAMPAGFPTCRVYFPGRYTTAITLDGPTYFTSGTYWFEQPVTIASGAVVVVGAGAVEGCTDDQDAAFYATGAPSTHGVDGLGATFVLAGDARIVVRDDASAGTTLVFNRRYPTPGDPTIAPSAGVSIITVNGLRDAGTGNVGPYVVPGVLEVPASLVGTNGASAGYLPSTHATIGGNTPAPIVDIVGIAGSEITVDIPGYVAAPQGHVRIVNPDGDSVRLTGGIIAATFEVSDGRGSPLPIGYVESIMQRRLRIVSQSDDGRHTSTAIVQVNENGSWAVNSWVLD